MPPSALLTVPNVSEGRDRDAIAAIARAFEGGDHPSDGLRLLDVHSDGDHHRSVYTLAGRQGDLADALLSGAEAVLQRVDVVAREAAGPEQAGRHPHVGSLDVVPVVYLSEDQRGQACAEALVVADRLAEELDLPVFLYGELTGRPPRSRAELRRGGIDELRRRIDEEGLRPDFGPARLHATAGATLVAARPPLVAFNLRLDSSVDIDRARRIASLVREGGGEGLPGLRAIAVELADAAVQVSMNVERPHETPLAAVVAAVARHAPVASAELVGLAPAAAVEDFPTEVPMPGFDPARHVIENALGSSWDGPHPT